MLRKMQLQRIIQLQENCLDLLHQETTLDPVRLLFHLLKSYKESLTTNKQSYQAAFAQNFAFFDQNRSLRLTDILLRFLSAHQELLPEKQPEIMTRLIGVLNNDGKTLKQSDEITLILNAFFVKYCDYDRGLAEDIKKIIQRQDVWLEYYKNIMQQFINDCIDHLTPPHPLIPDIEIGKMARKLVSKLNERHQDYNGINKLLILIMPRIPEKEKSVVLTKWLDMLQSKQAMLQILACGLILEIKNHLSPEQKKWLTDTLAKEPKETQQLSHALIAPLLESLKNSADNAVPLERSIEAVDFISLKNTFKKLQPEFKKNNIDEPIHEWTNAAATHQHFIILLHHTRIAFKNAYHTNDENYFHIIQLYASLHVLFQQNKELLQATKPAPTPSMQETAPALRL